jgi:hypothetical protein
METLRPIRLVVYGKPSVQVKDVLTGWILSIGHFSEALHDSEFDLAPLKPNSEIELKIMRHFL